MKKSAKRKSYSTQPEMQEPGVIEMISRMQQQLNSLDKKIDTLIGRSAEKSFNTEQPKPFQKPFQRFDNQRHQSDRRPDNGQNQRVLHKAICADCKKECEVPFKPSQDRPVYCKDCFSKRKGANPFRGSSDTMQKDKKPFYAAHVDKLHGVEKKKAKRPAVKRRKARGD